MTAEDQMVKNALDSSVQKLSECVDNGIIIMTGVDPDGSTYKITRPWGNGFAVTGAMKREIMERDAFEDMELDEATGYCTCADEED